jgi:glycerophosphoryl diester phosphodiesterase
MFECDVKLSADGVPFLMHDATLERTTNGIGLGGDQPWDQLARWTPAAGTRARMPASRCRPSRTSRATAWPTAAS